MPLLLLQHVQLLKKLLKTHLISCLLKVCHCTFNVLFPVLIGHRIKVLWGRSQGTLPVSNKSGGSTQLANVPGLPERELTITNFAVIILPLALPAPSFDPLNLKGVAPHSDSGSSSSASGPPPPPPPPPPSAPKYQYAPPPPPPGT